MADLVVTNVDAQLVILLLEQFLVDHLVQHLLLTNCAVNLLAVLLVVSGLLLHATLELHNVNFLIADFCGCAVTTGTTDGLDTYLNDKSNQSGTDYDGKDLFPLPNFL